MNRKDECDVLTFAGIVLGGLTAIVAFLKWGNGCDCN
jgi:hypothetical protein